ncbi:MAG: hypothetical protein AAF471_00405 [Myxococcota bacterium]
MQASWRSVVGLALAGWLAAAAAGAVSYQSPVPLSRDEPMRAMNGVAAGLHVPDGVGMRFLDTGFGFTHQPTPGLEWGLSVAGGVINAGNLFADADQVAGHVGFDWMGRMLGSITRLFFMGLQLELGYDHSFAKETIERFQGIHLITDLPLGVNLANLIYLYAAPGFGLDRMFDKDPADADATLFSSMTVGIQGRVGMEVFLGVAALVLNVTPNWRDVSRTDSFATDFLLGLRYEL